MGSQRFRGRNLLSFFPSSVYQWLAAMQMTGSHPRLHMLVTEGRTIQSVLTMLTCDMVGQQSHHLILVCNPNFLALSTSVPASTGFVPFLMEQEYATQDMGTRTSDASGRPATSIK